MPNNLSPNDLSLNHALSYRFKPIVFCIQQNRPVHGLVLLRYKDYSIILFMTNNSKDIRQRFFIDNSPVRGDVVSLEKTLDEIFSQNSQAYPTAVKKLLGEMLVAASLLASTIKISGRLSLQLQSANQNSHISWAMAECSHDGKLRALAKWHEGKDWQHMHTADDLLASLKADEAQSVLFINIEPEKGQRYQGVVEQVSDNLAACIRHYQEQSAQIPTLLEIASSDQVAGGVMLQKLPLQADEEVLDTDLWARLSSLTQTLSADELLNLPAKDILYRLYHEEEVRLPAATPLAFGCTCSLEKCLTALVQVGFKEVNAMFAELPAEQQHIGMDCQFCGATHHIDKKTAFGLFELPN